GDIRLEMTAGQARYRQGIRGAIMTVPPDADHVLYPCFMPEWLPTDLTQRTVLHGVAAVPDPKGKIRYLTRPADAFITMIMEGALLKLATETQEPALRPGESFDVPVILSRAAALSI